MLKDIIHNGLFVAAVLMFGIGASAGIVWGVHSLFGGTSLTAVEVKIFSRILCVLLLGSTGIFHMLSFWKYKRKRRAQWESNRG